MTDIDRGAIQELQALAVVALEPKFVKTDELPGDPFAMVPDAWHVEDLERFALAPTRPRGLVTLQDAASFCAWVNERKGDRTRIYASAPLPNGPHYAAVMDDTVDGAAPAWRQWRGLYTPLPSPEWAIWTGGNNKLVAQRDFAEFLEANADDVYSGAPSEPTSAQMLELAGSLTATTRAEFSATTRLQNGNTSIRYAETTTAAGGVGAIEVPEQFIIAIPVFVGGPYYKIAARFRYRLNGSVLTMGYALIRPHKVIEIATADITAKIADDCKVTIYTGTP